jgi:hypothetical protein
MSKKDLVNFNSILEISVNEIVVTAILNDIISEKKEFEMNIVTSLSVDIITIKSSDHETKFLNHIITFNRIILSHVIFTENIQSKTSKKLKTRLDKKRKIMKDESLHFDLQVLIILNFLVVNVISVNDAQ